VRFAQQVLNAVLGERLDVDGIHGRHTSTALKLFQCGLSLPITGRLDEVTLIALAQGAIEQIHQQSIFPRRGVMDDTTRQRIAEFRRSRGLADGPVLDEALMRSLMQRLQP
jgi:peptidoglycan hydrolase-like protein with peptidoglycan-binding domain